MLVEYKMHKIFKSPEILFIATIVASFAMVAFFVWDMFAHDRDYLAVYTKPVPVFNSPK